MLEFYNCAFSYIKRDELRVEPITSKNTDYKESKFQPVKTLVGEGKVKEAILLLDTFALATDSQNLLLLLHSRYNSVATSKLAGTISLPA